MKIVIAIDKFKGSATAQQLAQCINDAIVRKMPDAITCQVPIADGGDGTMHAIKTIMGNKVKEHMVMVHRPILNLNPVDAHYLLDESNHTAYMDLATASGLTLVPPLSRDIMSASTFGTGEMIAETLRKCTETYPNENGDFPQVAGLQFTVHVASHTVSDIWSTKGCFTTASG